MILFLISTSIHCCVAEEKRIGFIHITKSGGTAIEYSGYHKFITGRGHKATIGNFSNTGDRAICVIREPISRFISIYNFWRYGSEMFERETYWKPPVDSLQDFISAASSLSHPKHAEVVKTMNSGRGYTWQAHFKPQKQWLRRGRKKNVVLIRHDSDSAVFKQRVVAAFSELGIEEQEVSEINVSTRLENDTNTANYLSDFHVSWIKEYYKADFKLWEVANRQHNSGEGPWRSVH